MAQWSQSRYKDVVGRGRMDGEYHSHSARNVENRLVKSGMTLSRLRDCCERITSGHTPLRHNLNLGDVFFVTVECVSPLLIDYGLTKRVNISHYYGELSRVALTSQCVVVTIKRRIAQASPCYDLRGETVVNQDVAVLRLRNGWNPGYIAAYLISKIGQQLADRERTEQMNPYLPVNKLGNLLIPRIEISAQQSVDDLIKQRFECLAASERAYAKAQNLLDSELGLDKLSFKKPVGYTAQFSELEKSRRSDSEFFNPELRYFWNNLSHHFELTPIPTVASVLKFSNPTYGTSGMPIVTQKHLRVICPDGYGNELRTTDSWQGANSNAVLQHNDLLFYSVGAYLGKTNIWLNTDGAVPASFITLLRCQNKINAGFLQVLLNSRYGFLQSNCFQSGTSQQYIYPKDIRNFLIPVVGEKLKERIHLLVVESFEKGLEAKNLLKQAKTRVEQLIEEAVRR